MTGVGENLNMSHLVCVRVCVYISERRNEHGDRMGDVESLPECMSATNHVIENAYQTVILF